MTSKAWLLLALPVLSLACGPTAQVRRTFPVSVAAKTTDLVTDSGWTVTLTRADAALATARFFTGKVLLSRRWSPLSLIYGTAYAHPGHYAPGEALGELLTPVKVDLLKGETPWGTANGVTGDYGSLELTYDTDGLRLAGTATKAGQAVTFDTGAYRPPPLEGTAFDHVMDTKPGTAVLTIDLQAVISRMEFEGVSGTLDPTSVAFNGFARGVKDTSAYSTTWK